MAISMGNKLFFRAGVTHLTSVGYRAMVTQTWCLDPLPTNPIAYASLYAYTWTRLLEAMQPHGTDDLHLWQPFIQQIWPTISSSSPVMFSPVIGGATLNAAAPEAAVRLQRVGADGSLGRMAWPITDDSWFTDRPHRRHVDVSHINSRFQFGLFAAPQSYSFVGGTITNVIIHRAAKTYSPVDHFEVLDNPIRIWARWRRINYAARHVESNRWGPDNLHAWE